VPIFADIHAGLTSSLISAILKAYHCLSLVQLFVSELPFVLFRQLHPDRWAGPAVFNGNGTEGVYSNDNLAHVLTLVQISGLEDISVLESECLAAFDELFDVLHLFKGHLLGVNLFDKRLSIKSVQQLAKHLSVLEAVLEIVHSNLLVGELLVQNLFNPCSALYLLIQVIFSLKLLLDVPGETRLLCSMSHHKYYTQIRG